MKTRIIYYFGITLAFLLVFYHQSIGINLLIFTAIVLLLSVCFQPKFGIKKALLFVALIITAFSSAYFGDAFSIIITVFLLLLVPVFQHNQNSLLLLAPFQSFLNYLFQIAQFKEFFLDFSLNKPKNSSLKFLTFFLLPLFLAVIFILIYREINVEFKALFSNFCFPNFDYQILFLLVVGSFYSFGMWYYYDWLDTKDNKYTTKIIATEIKEEERENLNIWVQSGILIFSILNIILILLLYFDFSEIIGLRNSTQTFSEAVHVSTQAVIGSIVVAIALVLAYFSNKLNFLKNSKMLKTTAYIWMILNTILIASTFIKNNIYIHEYGLTLKRLGVVAFLFLCLVGILFTFYKLYKNRTNFFLLQRMSWVFLLFGTLICPINWSKIITQHNIKLHTENKLVLDIDYLNQLEFNHYEMIKLEADKPNLFHSNISEITKFQNHKKLYGDENFLSQTFYNYYTDYKLKH